MTERKSAPDARQFQLRLPRSEDEEVQWLADRQKISKNDIVRRALRLLARLERETQGGARLILERPGTAREAVEVWLL